jgi:glc operon protein GlcG
MQHLLPINNKKNKLTIMQVSRIAAILALSAMIISAASARAQVIASNNITLEAAKKVVAEAVKYAKANNAPGGSIAVVDNGGNLVYLERLDGTFPASSEVSIKKANTAALFKTATVKLETSINGGRQALITVGHTFLQGGIPILYNGQVIGAVGVSGASSAQQDEEIAIAGSKAAIQAPRP